MDKFTVRDASGAVDVLASATKYAEALQVWVSQNEADPQHLTDVVNAVFDRYNGQTLPMPALVSQAVSDLGATPAEYAAFSKRVHAHIRGMAGEGGSLTIAKGKGGGVSRKVVEPVTE
jgi:hypothetical protein